MSEHKFYYPDGSPITTNCPQKTFLEYYNKQYYRKDSLKSNPIICGKNADDIDEDHPYTKRLIRSNYDVETIICNILKNGIHSHEDMKKVLAWKIGKIKHSAKTNGNTITYHSDWETDNGSEVTLYWKENEPKDSREDHILNYKNLFEFVKEYNYPNKWSKNEAETFFDALLEQNFKWIGPVYALTILCFVSKEMWPIYDRFAFSAINAISNKAKPGATIKSVPLTFNNYCDYKNAIVEEFNTYNRDIDRALWVYGHLFITGNPKSCGC